MIAAYSAVLEARTCQHSNTPTRASQKNRDVGNSGHVDTTVGRRLEAKRTNLGTIQSPSPKRGKIETTAKTLNTHVALARAAFIDSIAAEDAEAMETFEALLADRKMGVPKTRISKDANWGKCDDSCVTNNHISQCGIDTFVCRLHMRVHVCNSVSGDDHPVVLVEQSGARTCLFSGYTVRGSRAMVVQDYSVKDKSSRKVLPSMTYCNALELEAAEEDKPTWNEEEARAIFLTGKPSGSAEQLGSRTRKRRRTVGEGTTDEGVGITRGKSSQEVVRAKVSQVLSRLTNKHGRTKIVNLHVKRAIREARKQLPAYRKQCHRRGEKCIYPRKQMLAKQILMKHSRCVPSVNRRQIEYWTEIVELLWFHFSPFRKKPRSTTDPAKDSSAGVLPFIFGCLYAMAEGRHYSGKEFLPKDSALAEVMPPAADLKLLGYKHQLKSMGRKAFVSALSASVGTETIQMFTTDRLAAIKCLGP